MHVCVCACMCVCVCVCILMRYFVCVAMSMYMCAYAYCMLCVYVCVFLAHGPAQDGVHSDVLPPQQGLHGRQLERVLGDADVWAVCHVQGRLDHLRWLQHQEIQVQVGWRRLGHLGQVKG